jgi:regulator of protease activity HflC (stomatin/prohibitin superfamily)
MADITRRLIWRHLRGTPTSHVVHLSHGRPAHSGAGLAFWFRALTASLSEIPVDDRELPMLFHARTADFQDVSVQATIGYRFADPVLTATRIDFAIDPDTGRWRGSPLDQVALLLTELAQQHALGLLAARSLPQVLADGVEGVRDRIEAGLAGDPRLAGVGIAVVGIRVVALRPEPDVERALQTPARELVQQDADRATYERRAVAVERERAIGENELQSRIELAAREETLVTQQAANARITEQAAADRVRLAGAAEADAERARMAVYQQTDPRMLAALALRGLAENLPSIDSLTVSPDLLSAGLSRLLAGSER